MKRNEWETLRDALEVAHRAQMALEDATAVTAAYLMAWAGFSAVIFSVMGVTVVILDTSSYSHNEPVPLPVWLAFAAYAAVSGSWVAADVREQSAQTFQAVAAAHDIVLERVRVRPKTTERPAVYVEGERTDVVQVGPASVELSTLRVLLRRVEVDEVDTFTRLDWGIGDNNLYRDLRLWLAEQGYIEAGHNYTRWTANGWQWLRETVNA